MLFSKKSPSLFLSSHVYTLRIFNAYVKIPSNIHLSQFTYVFTHEITFQHCISLRAARWTRAKRPPRLYTRRCIISIDSRTRVPARVTWIAAYRDGPSSARRAASQYKVSPSFPYPPTLPPSTSASFAPPALAHPPSRAINERVIDARSVNRLLPFINSPGRRAAVAA